MSLKAFAKRVPGLRPFVKGAKSLVKDLKTIPVFLAEQKLSREYPIRVGFFCQYLPAWAKVSPIYEQMQKDPRFEPYLLCLPSAIENGCLKDPDDLENDTYAYMQSIGYDEAINLLVGKEQWLDLKTLNLSYIFYPRPYNSLVPVCYQSQNVSRYSRICILMYGMSTTEETTSTTLNRDFMANVYAYFAETNFAKRVNIRKNRLLHMLKLQKTMCIGYPVLEQLAKMKDVQSPSWSFSQNDFRVLWTPRWSTAKEVGGSNFFTYKDFFLQYARENPNVDILMRPHPLMFPNFLKTGEMTQEQVNSFKMQVENMPNTALDPQSQYEATLWGSDVLVTDLSGIVPEYFTTGKPVIFCITNMELKLADYFEEMVRKGCYVVKDETQLRQCLEMLQKGDDPMKQARLALIPELFGPAGEDATAHIVQEIAADAAQRK